MSRGPDAAPLTLELVGQRSLEIELAEADFLALGWSPLFNSLRHRTTHRKPM